MSSTSESEVTRDLVGTHIARFLQSAAPGVPVFQWDAGLITLARVGDGEFELCGELVLGSGARQELRARLANITLDGIEIWTLRDS